MVPHILKSHVDIENKRMAILTNDDKIHIDLEFDKYNNLFIYARWNVDITILGAQYLKSLQIHKAFQEIGTIVFKRPIFYS